MGAGYRGTFKLCLSDVVDYNFYEGAVDVTGLINGCSADAAYTTVNATGDKSKGAAWEHGSELQSLVQVHRYYRIT
ncbi:MAG: hypothetical protein U5K54_14980 [Cytophagales bacterium]|nr:hypothetical protein [Cytophagales bacterium]